MQKPDTLIEILVGIKNCPGELLLCQPFLQGRRLDAHTDALQRLGGIKPCGVFSGGQQELFAAVVPGPVGDGEIETLLPLGKPAEARDGKVDIALRNSILAVLKAHGYDLQLHAQALCQIVCKAYIEAHKPVLSGFGVVDEFHRREIRRHGHPQNGLLYPAAAKQGKDQNKYQNQSDPLFHLHQLPFGEYIFLLYC